MTTPTLSIIIPIHNDEHTIVRMLDSIAAQSCAQQIEVIVVDDKSTDDGLNVVHQWAVGHSLPMRSIANESNLGAMHSRLKGFSMSSAPYIMFADADDKLAGNANLEQALYLAEQKPIDIMHCASLEIAHDGKEIGITTWSAPFLGLFRQPELFQTFFTSRLYPPISIWGKIFRRPFFSKIYELAKKHVIYRSDDKFLISLAIGLADSYMGHAFPIYAYKPRSRVPLERYGGRLCDFHTLLKCMPPILAPFPPEARAAYFAFLRKRIAYQMGKFCVEAEDFLCTQGAGKDAASLLFPFDEPSKLLQALLLSLSFNAAKLEGILKNMPFGVSMPGLPAVSGHSEDIVGLSQKLCQAPDNEPRQFSATLLCLARSIRNQFDQMCCLPENLLDAMAEKLATNKMLTRMILSNAQWARALQDTFHLLQL